MKDELYALRYYLVFAGVVVVFFLYSGITGWKWIGATTTQTSEKTNSGYRYRYFHK